VALYVPEGTRRRRLLVAACAALVLGLVAGGLGGRLSAPSVTAQVRQVQDDAHATSAGLRVIALHEQAGTGAGGSALVLTRTKQELESEFSKAPWLSTATKDALRTQLAALTARTDRSTSAFGDAAEVMARAIDSAFAS
jgi:hypothetical protein